MNISGQFDIVRITHGVSPIARTIDADVSSQRHTDDDMFIFHIARFL
jgi:hypothetical protein